MGLFDLLKLFRYSFRFLKIHSQKIIMAYEIVLCKYCNSSEVVRYGTQSGHSRFRCKDCGRIFKRDYIYRTYEPGIKGQIVEMAMNGSGIRDTARVLEIGKNTVISALKKSPQKWSQ